LPLTSLDGKAKNLKLFFSKEPNPLLFKTTLGRQSSKTSGRKTLLKYSLVKRHNSLRVASGFSLADFYGVEKQVLGY
jgi:hypothetical protein